MLREYRYMGLTFQFEEGQQPEGAEPVEPEKKAKRPANKSRKPADKARKESADA